MTQEDWDEYTERLWRLNLNEAHCLDWCRYHMCIILFPWLLLPCLCIPWSSCDAYQRGMEQWLEDFNKELEPKGIFVKAFCFKQMTSRGNRWDEGTLAVLAFALTPEETARLRREPVLQQGPHCKDENWSCWCCAAHQHRVV